jgi:hypothetical protein
MELENIILSEVSHGSESQRLHVFSHMWNIDLIQIQAILWKTAHTKGRPHMRGRVKEGG